MAATILISALLCIFIVWVSYDYSRFKGKLIQYQATIERNEAKFLQTEENHLKNTQLITNLQNRLHQATTDPVTNLLGWHLFEDRLNQSLRESIRYQFTLAVMLVDVDEFKVINNALGHDVGDALLREVAVRLRGCIRQVDSISRLSKDMFAIMLPQLGKPETAAIVAQRMLQAIAQPFHIGQHELYASICIGIAIFPHDSQELTGLLRGAEYALRLAKENGKQSYQFFQERMNVDSQRELALSNGLRRESINQELVVYYQAIQNIHSQSIFGMEALLRWKHPEFGLVDTTELYAYAVRQARMNNLTEWLIRDVCRQFLYWRSVGLGVETVAIPVFIKQLENSNFIYHIAQILQEMDFKPEWLLLDVKFDTERPIEAVEKGFNMLNYMGIKLCVSDFGAGHFSLLNLKNHRVQFLKLSPTLIAGSENDNYSMILLKSIIQLCTDLGIQLIASGVETEQQANLLKSLGCNLMQGGYIAAPVEEKEVVV